MSGFLAIVRRDLRLAFRQGMDSLMVVAFFVIAVVLFPFGVGPQPNTLARIAPGVIWVAEKFYMWISRNRLFLSRVFGCKGACVIMPERNRDQVDGL